MQTVADAAGGSPGPRRPGRRPRPSLLADGTPVQVEETGASDALDGRAGGLTLTARLRGRSVGVVEVVPVDRGAAEVTVTVAPAERTRGVATLLLETAAERARRRGIDRFLARVPADNGRMLQVLTDLGLPLGITRDGTTLRVEVGLHPDERYAAAAADRRRAAAAAGLSAVLTPASVAVVGAGRRQGSVGRLVLQSVVAAGYRGALAVVHPDADEVDGIPCVPSLAALPRPPELVVVAVPADRVLEVVDDAGTCGARAVLVVSSGISAVPELAARLRDTAERAGLRLLGPNTVGVVGPGSDASGRFAATFGPTLPASGDVGLVTQSGGVAIAAAAALERLGLGARAALSVGDAVDLGVDDALAWFDRDPGTALVLLHEEGSEDLRGLVRAARHLSRRVPVLALASGTSTAGRRAAASHTARAATATAVREAAWSAGGILGFDDVTTMAATAALLRGQPLPAGRRCAVLTNVGGTGVLVADALTAAGMGVDPFPEALRQRLTGILPPLAATANPVDTSAVVSPEAFAAALRCLREDSAVDAVVTVTVPTAAGDPHDGVRVGAGTTASPVPVVDVRPTRATALERLGLAGGGFVVSVQEPATAALALAAALRRAAWTRRLPDAAVVPEGVDYRTARIAVDAVVRRNPARGWLSPDEVGALCASAGLHPVPTVVVRTAQEVSAAVRAAAGPVVLKGVVEGVVHKADAGLLRMPVSDPAEAARTVEEWAARWGDRWQGAVVQTLVPSGDEWLVGGVRDPAAGPVVAVGPGGRATDALGHRVHRLAPLSGQEAEDMVAATGLLGTEHGRGLDRGAVTDALHRVGWLLEVLPELSDVEVNPLVVREHGALALDVRMRVAGGDGERADYR